MKSAVLLLLVSAALAQVPPPAPATPRADQPSDLPREKAKLQGRAVSAVTGEPLRKVNLTLRPSAGGIGMGSYTAVTDNDGNFLFEVDAGRYILSGDKAGFVRQNYNVSGGAGGSTVLTVAPGQHLKDIAFKLTPQGVIAGKVTDDEGEPLQGVSVQVMRWGFRSGKRSLLPAGGGGTNDQGEFRIANLTAGRYYLSATHARVSMMTGGPERSAARGPEEGFVATYYPNAADASGAAPIEITAGAEVRGIEIRLRKTRVYSIRGKVIVPSGGPMQGVMLRIVPRDSAFFFGPGNMARVQNPEGSFEIPAVAPGSYMLIGQTASNNQPLFARVPIDVGNENVEGVVVTITAGFEIAGVVRMEGEDPKFRPSNLRVALSPLEGMALNAANAQVKEDGAFKLSNVVPDKYRVEVFPPPPDGYIKSIRYAGQEALDTGIDLSGGGGGSLEIVLSPNAGEISGSVQNSKGEPAPGVTVSIAAAGGALFRRDLFKTANTDQNGAFRVLGVTPGDYKVFAWEEIEFGAAEDPEFRKPFESYTAAAKVREKSVENVQVKLIPRETIEAEKAKMK